MFFVFLQTTFFVLFKVRAFYFRLYELVTLNLVNYCNNAALSIYEQKKYKRNTDAQGLYSTKDDVEILNVDNFKREVYGNQRALLIEFYNSWCGFCQRFAPSWKALATDVKDWSDVVGIGALDCYNEENYPLCRDFEVMTYPTLRYFHENYQEGPGNFGKNIKAGSDVNEHRQKLLQVIIEEQNEGRGKMYPDMLPYTYPDDSKLFESASENVKYVFLIIQQPTDFIGQDVIMDLHRIKDIVVKYTFNNNTDLVKSFKADLFPALYVMERGNTLQLLNSGSATRESYKVFIHNYLLPKNINVPVDNKNKSIFTGKWLDAPIQNISAVMQERELENLMEKVRKMGDVVFQMDLETALRYSLKREVSRVKEISGEKLNALKSYLNVLSKYFPFGKFGHYFLSEINEYVSNNPTVKGADIFRMVKEAESEERQVFSLSTAVAGL
ncbi:hypothetical protein NQ317_011076 [Molorchus minor]|uniref:Thioredoxin domain-containing protein n=1 Tax=Molorchus minor TaxID=1323400 RepID=A0ABQ9JC09_9CUCU|nr:hypothetical protein NQ317_011076 [Molorchus minor]